MYRGHALIRLGAAVAVLAWLVGLPLFYFWPNIGAHVMGFGGPHADLPRLETFGQLLAGAAVVLAGWTLGRPLVRLLLPRWRGWSGVLQACALGLGVLSVLDLILAGIGVYWPTPVSVIVILIAGAGAVWLLRDARPTFTWHQPSLAAAVTIGLLVIVLGFAAVGALAPETQYDALWYHLGFPAEWLRTGRLTFFPWQYVSAYPFATELLYGNAIALAGPIAAKVVDLAFGLLVVGATIDLGRRLFSTRAALLGALCLAVAPSVLWDATTANTDLAATAFAILAMDVAVARVEQPDRRTSVACGLLMGFGLAAKLTAAFALPAVLLLLLAGPRLRAFHRRVGDATLAGGLSLLPVMPYLIRSDILTGNPVFPSFYGVFGANASVWNADSNAGLQSVLGAFGKGHGPLAFLTLPWDITMHAAAFGGAFGILLVVGAPLALRWRPRRMPALVALGALSYTLLWFWPGGTLQARFLIPAVAMIAPFAGAGIERTAVIAERCWRPLWLAVLLCTAGLAVLTLPPFINYQSHDGKPLSEVLYQTPLPYVLGSESATSYLTSQIPTYGAELRLQRLAAPGDRVLVITHYDIDQVDTPIEHVPYFAVSVDGIYVSNRAALEDLRSLRIRFIMWGGNAPGSQGLVVGQPQFKRRYLRLVYQDSNTLLYELRTR